MFFAGYYDLEPLKDEKLLVHVCDLDDKTSENKIEIGYFNVKNKQYQRITESSAWCWQQGSRLRWSNIENNTIFYNDVKNGEYCCIKYDIAKEKIIQVIPFAIYDMNFDETYGISLNFDRLQKLRPGYGYDSIKNEEELQNAPDDDGLFLVNMQTGRRELIISLGELAKNQDKKIMYKHYINHISFSKDGNKIMFFHLWDQKEKFNWKTELCIYDMKNKNTKIIEQNDLVSHYNWKDNENILITGINYDNNEEFYRYYNIETNERVQLNNITRDGHPIHKEVNNNIFYSDTYPDFYDFQKLFKYDVIKRKKTRILNIYSEIKLNGEKRCDLHPKYIQNKDVLLIDTTFKQEKRSVLYIKLKEE